MRPKIAIATIVDRNLGNRLQNYALQTVLETLTDSKVETLFASYGFTVWKRRIKKYLVDPARRLRRRVRYYFQPQDRLGRFEDFDKRHINYARRSIDDKNLASVGYSLFVIGSDQVWNPNFCYTDGFSFLPQVPPKNKISYSASFGVASIDADRERISRWLDDISRISVREEAGQRIVKDLTDREATLALDPTMLLSTNEWLAVAERPQIDAVSDEYVLKYVLGQNIPDEIVVEMSGGCSNVIDLKDKTLPVGPAEFVWLIANAKYVCTDSFHGSVFSILFHTPFAIFERVDHVKDMSSRIDTLSHLFDLDGRRIRNRDEVIDLRELQWLLIDERLSSEREKSLGFLKGCLHDAELL